MINPDAVTNYHRTISELEEWLLFSIIVAGKTAHLWAPRLDRFLSLSPAASPFASVRQMIEQNTLRANLETARLGNYSDTERSFRELMKANLDLRTCTVEELGAIHKIGSKTGRMFLLHSREGFRGAVLDVHTLRDLGEKLGIKVPKDTPPPKRYAELERLWLDFCDQQGHNLADYDLTNWSARARRPKLVTV